MDFAGFQLRLVEIIGVLLLGGVLAWAVIRTNSGGKKDSPDRTEQATHDLYKREEQRNDSGTEDL